MARWRWRRTSLGGEADRAAFRALHNASLASPALREGLTSASAERSVRHLRALLERLAQRVVRAVGVRVAPLPERVRLGPDLVQRGVQDVLLQRGPRRPRGHIIDFAQGHE